MKTSILLSLCLLLISFTAKAQGTGAGVIIGDPTALSVKSFMTRDQAWDAGLSYNSREFLIYGDYLKHFPGTFRGQNAFISSLNPYVGVGPVLAFRDGDKDNGRFIEEDEDDFAFGGRIPLGIEWISREIPIGVSLEVAPGIVVIPGTDAFVQGGLAIRYYFK